MIYIIYIYKILNKKKKFHDVISVGQKIYNSNSDDTQLTYLLGLASINIQDFIQGEKYFLKLVSIKENFFLKDISPKVYFLENVDEWSISRLTKKINLQKIKL